MNGTAAIPFVIKGVDYSPRPMNDAAMTFPGTDYFWGDPAHLTYGPIWRRYLRGATYNDGLARVNFPDGLVRQLGANSIRTYAWWNGFRGAGRLFEMEHARLEREAAGTLRRERRRLPASRDGRRMTAATSSWTYAGIMASIRFT